MRKNGLIPVYILKILSQTDASHRLTQKDLLQLLHEKYDVKISRGTLGSYLHELRQAHYISGERGIYRNRDLSDEEIRIVIDSVLFGHLLPQDQAKALIGKLQSLGSLALERKVRAIHELPDINHNNNEHLYEIMEALDEAIENHKRVRITSCRYGIDKQLHETSTRIVDPYYIVSDLSRFYLICHNDGSDDLGNRRLDRMAKVEILEEGCVSIRTLSSYAHGFDLGDYMREHIYMFAGDSETCQLKIVKDHIGDFIDWYGTSFHVMEEDEEYVLISAKINTQALYYWVLQYGEMVEVLSPLSLREKVKAGLTRMLARYQA